MSESTAQGSGIRRVSSGVIGIDTITRGGLLKGGIYVVVGRPGSGKTTFGNQICFRHVKSGGRAAYITLLSETHASMLAQMRMMSFYDETQIGKGLLYLNGFGSLESEGLAGLLKLVRGSVRDQKAEVLVLDGIFAASALAKSNVDYKKFINELQTWVGVVGCTVLFLTSGGPNVSVEPEYTMVDGIIELNTKQVGLQRLRQLFVRKFRGGSYLEGGHPYEISSEGLVVYPRVEGQFNSYPHPNAETATLKSGAEGLDRILGGGYGLGSMTLVIGPSGTGKTTVGLQYLAAGLAGGERAVHFGFYETPADVTLKAEQLGLSFEKWQSDGLLRISWQPPAEQILDALAYRLIVAVREHKAQRLLIDGLIGFKTCAYAERLPGFFAVLQQELRALRVTTLITEEGTKLLMPGMMTPAASALFDNVIAMRGKNVGGRMVRTLRVKKARSRLHDASVHVFELGERGVAVRSNPADSGPLGGGDMSSTGR